MVKAVCMTATGWMAPTEREQYWQPASGLVALISEELKK